MKALDRFHSWRPLLGVLCALVLSGCLGKTPPSRFYLLTSTEASGSADGDGAAEMTGPSVLISAVDLPAYVLVPQIVTRSDRNTLQLAEFDRWGEPLRDSFLRVLAKNLGQLLPTSSVTTYPWERRGVVDRHVTIVVTRFDAQDGEVILSTRWGVVGPDPDAMQALRRAAYRVPVEGEGYAAIAAAMSEAIAALSADIAGAIDSE